MQALVPAVEGVKGEPDAGQRQGLGESVSRVVCGKWAEGRKPKSCVECATTEQPSSQGGKDEAGKKVEGYLRIDDGGVMFASKEGEAKDEEGGVAREPDEGRLGRSGDPGEAIDSMIEPVPGDVTVDQGVSCDGSRVAYEPEPQEESGDEGEDDAECRKAPAGSSAGSAGIGRAAGHVAASYCEESRNCEEFRSGPCRVDEGRRSVDGEEAAAYD